MGEEGEERGRGEERERGAKRVGETGRDLWPRKTFASYSKYARKTFQGFGLISFVELLFVFLQFWDGTQRFARFTTRLSSPDHWV